MSYDKRFDGRKFDELRPVEAKAGIIKRADGSAMFKIGKTTAFAAVYGPRNLYPKFKQNPTKGILRVNYNMMPFSGSGERIRPGGSRRAKEISFVTEQALLPVLNLKEFPNSVIDIFIELPQTDAGTRCAGICAASMALADAGIPMRELVGAVAVGKVDDKVLVDLNYNEEAYEDGDVADVPIAITENSEKITLLQMDGRITRKEINEALKLGKKALKQVFELEREALIKKYEGD